ncbi:MAG: hypothetical protein ABI234_01040, partial [Ktedonobacteraceae bacterium]
MTYSQRTYRATLALLKYLTMLAFCCWLTGCDIPGISASTRVQCQSNCTLSSGVRGVHVIVEPEAGPTPLVDAIHSAQKSVDVEIYILSNHNIIRALEEDANRGIEVRV